MVSGCPSLIQVTLVAGEPVEIQVKVEDMEPYVSLRCVMLGGAGREPHSSHIQVLNWYSKHNHELGIVYSTSGINVNTDVQW